MRKLALLLLFLAPGYAMAQSEVCSSSVTVNTVVIASHTATLVESAAVVMPDRKFVEYQNVSTDTIRCSQLSTVTTSTGRLLAANGGTYSLSMKDVGTIVSRSTSTPHISYTNTSLKMYCIGSGTNITSSLAITQCK